jgi:hypothetical protein
MAKCWLCNKRFGVLNIFSSAGAVEAKELYVFPGCALDGNEIALEDGIVDAEMLENLVPLKLNTDFEDALTGLEAIVVQPERIIVWQVKQQGVKHDEETGEE